MIASSAPCAGRRRGSWLAGGWSSGFTIVACLALAKVVLHLASDGAFVDLGWSYFVDELYYLACSRHLAWGFVDLPPLMPAITAVTVALFGDSVVASRLPVTIAGGALVLLAGALAREMGGDRFAQGLAALATLCAPILLAVGSFNSMNGFEPVLWAGCAWVLVRLANGGKPGWWLLFGILAGLSLLNKHTALLYGFAALVGLILTAQRRALRERWFWLAGLCAFAIFLPNLIWMMQHRFPHLEVLANIRADGRDVELSALEFLAQQVVMAGPVGFILALAALAALMRRGAASRYRHLGIAFLCLIGVLATIGGRVYYSLSAWVPMFCLGAVAIETWLRPRRLAGLGRAALLVATAVCGIALAPQYIPVLPPASQARLLEAGGFGPPQLENHASGRLPQLLADRLAWRPIAEAVAEIYQSLPPEEQERAAIFGQGYGEAGAILAYADEMRLPLPLSGHLSYWLWGYGDHRGDEVWIVIGDDDRLADLFASVEFGGYVEQHPLAMPRWIVSIWVCRGLRLPLAQLWPEVKNYH